MLDVLWSFLKNHGLLIAVVAFFLFRTLFKRASGPMPEFSGHKVKSIHSDADWEAAMNEAQSKKMLVVADFFATWCGPCRTAAPVFGKMSTEYDDVLFVKVDVDEARNVAMQNNIRAMPTFILFKGGKNVDSMMGWSESKLRAMLERHK